MTNKYLLGLTALIVSLAIHLAISFIWPQMTTQQTPSASPQAPSIPMLAKSFSDLVNDNSQTKPTATKTLTPAPITSTTPAEPAKTEVTKPIVTNQQTIQPTENTTTPIQTSKTKVATKPVSTTSAATPVSPTSATRPVEPPVLTPTTPAPKVTTTVPTVTTTVPTVKTKPKAVTTSITTSEPKADTKAQQPSLSKAEKSKPVQTTAAAIKPVKVETVKPVQAEPKTASMPPVSPPMEPLPQPSLQPSLQAAKPQPTVTQPVAVPASNLGQATTNQPASAAVEAISEAAKGYPKLVFQHIASKPQRKVRGKGTVTIEFKLTPQGTIAYAKIAKSSGRSRIDKAALNHVKRAAPFPTPPAQATLNFVLPISIR